LLTVPTFVVPQFADLAAFAFVAVAWLALVLVCSRPVPVAAAAITVAIAVVVAIAAPAILPRVTPGGVTASGAGGFAGSVNPILTLGADLRRPDAQPALTYTTTSSGGTYLRLAVLDDLTGQSWLPTPLNGNPGTDLAAIGPVPGVSADVSVIEETTTVAVAGVSSKWLPVPYAPTKITGLKGNWVWDRSSLVLSSDRSTLSDQVYEVTSARAAPSVQQLQSASPTADPLFRRDLTLPPDLPAIVAETALAVVGTASTDYDKAVALQSYFSGGQFTYSEKAPVDAGYDGSGARVLEAFLRAKSGYCVHFASAMTAMARTLGIPARVAVGFTPGQAAAGSGSGSLKYQVTTHDLHAWPELYFAGVGWVRFEPTPGRGIAPEFAPLVKDNPATPNVDESIPVPSASRTPAPTPTSTPSLPAQDAAAAGSPTSVAASAEASVRPWQTAVAVLILFLLAIPALARIARRRSNLRAVMAGSAVSAWDELSETAIDLGMQPHDALTPRQTASVLGAELDADPVAALERLRGSIERESFAGRAGEPQVEDVRVVLRALRGRVGLVRRVVATVFPRSLVLRVRGLRPDAARSRS
jgi:transglutaminase-like putative cysteine protease